MVPPVLEFWFEFASTYSYLAAARIGTLALRAGVLIEWRPFLLGPIFAAQGWSDSPFNLFPAKGHYMWRDLERLCAGEGLPFRRPSQFPRNGLLAARVALVAAREGWCDSFAPAVYLANFAADRDIAATETVSGIVRAVGRDPEVVLAQALTADNKAALKVQTEKAMKLGIFGAPSFTVGGELFWGNDRLEQAIAWSAQAAHGKEGV